MPPTGVAPLYHWYDGEEPPLAGVAVRVTELASQTGLLSAAIVTLTSNIGFTVMVIIFEVAGFPLAQVSLEVSTTLIISPLTGI